MTGDFHYRTQIAASADEVDRVCCALRPRIAAAGYNYALFKIELILREMLNNAVIHGCHNDASLFVRLALGISDGTLEVEVIDDGPGFDWQKAMDRAYSPTATSGRGLCLLKLHSSSIAFNPNGNSVRVCRDLGMGPQ